MCKPGWGQTASWTRPLAKPWWWQPAGEFARWAVLPALRHARADLEAVFLCGGRAETEIDGAPVQHISK